MSARSGPPTDTAQRLRRAVGACRSGFWMVLLFSLFINLLMLTTPLYMLQIYDRVIASRSDETLIYLTLIAGGALLTLALMEFIRTRVMVGLSNWMDGWLSGTVLEGSIGGSLAGGGAPSIQGLRDLSTVRTFLTGPSVFPILDAPWTPIFIGVIYLMHPTLGWLSLGGAIVLFCVAIANELSTRSLLQRAAGASMAALRDAEQAARNAHVIEAMGMMSNIVSRWHDKNAEMLSLQARASVRGGAFTSVARFIRQGLQIGILGVGAWLVLRGEVTPGVMIAGSILMGRALAPVDQAIGGWKSAVAARGAYRRLKEQLARTPERGSDMELPTPQGRISAEGATYFHPGASEPTLRNVSFRLEPGEAMGLIGPTAAGKSTLASLLVGIAAPRMGHVRLDGADVAGWASDDLGRHIGYLPQDIELFGGTVRENIARMGEGEATAVIAAAQLAAVHEMILALPDGYETQIGADGTALSGGQRQRIALARAVYGSPRFVVLDEPNASLDSAGEEALIEAIGAMKASGATLVVIAHRPSMLRHVDKVMILRNGVIEAFGPKDEVLKAVSRQQIPAQGGGA